MECKAAKLFVTRFIAIFFALTVGVLSSYSQNAAVTVTLDEKFFDSLLNSVFENFEPPEFSVAQKMPFSTVTAENGSQHVSFAARNVINCSQSVKILREMKGVRTSVKFRDGKIYVPLAFSGNYSPPFVGCVEFAGWAEANVDLEFEPQTQRLVGRVRVFNVNLNGTGGICCCCCC